MNIAFTLALGIFLFCSLSLIIIPVMQQSLSLSKARAFAQIVHPRRTRRRTELRRNTFARLVDLTRLLRSSLRMTEDPALQRLFERAGLPLASSRDMYFAARFAGPLLMLILGSFCPFARILVMCAGAGIAYLLPALVLGRLVKRHQKAVQLGVPDTVDLLVICVDAGLGLDQAMVRVGEELSTSHPAITHEIGHINREQRAGKPRLEAWREMADRVDVPETDALTNMLMQTERFGTPISRALSSFGDTIRTKRRQKAEEMAAKTTIKIIFPLVFFIFPCIFIVLLGPAAISILHSVAANK